MVLDDAGRFAGAVEVGIEDSGRGHLGSGVECEDPRISQGCGRLAPISAVDQCSLDPVGIETETPGRFFECWIGAKDCDKECVGQKLGIVSVRDRPVASREEESIESPGARGELVIWRSVSRIEFTVSPIRSRTAAGRPSSSSRSARVKWVSCITRDSSRSAQTRAPATARSTPGLIWCIRYSRSVRIRAPPATSGMLGTAHWGL